jgi:multidrug efflux pump subunit AcrA (membrane-fusion protein)
MIEFKELLMKMFGREVHSPVGLVFGLGMGLLGAWALPLIVPTRGAPSQIETVRQTVAKPAAKSDVPARASPSTGKPATAKVEKGPFKIEVALSGVFQAERMTEVSIRPKAWALPLVVERAIELGTPVKKGDILVEFDRDKIEKAIQDSEVENALAELTLKQAQEELPLLEKALPVDLAAAERSKTQADEDLKKFLEIDRSRSERNAQFMVKRSVEYLEYSKEELRQLEKMYRSKDLTEETEEIILRRQRFQVESSEFTLKENELQRDQVLKVDLPRQEQHVRENAVKQSIDLEKARALFPLNVNQKRRALAKLKYDHAKSAEKLADLRQDRDALTVHAPVDGLVYYGRCERGQWSAAATAPKLHKGGVIAPDEAFITVVTPRPVDIRATVDEKDLYVLSQPNELKGLVTPTFDPEHRLPGRLTSILPVPREAGKFEALIAVEIGDDKAAIKPGMACTVKFVPYRKEDVLTVPSSAVFEDDSADVPTHHVYLAKPDKDGKFPKRQVKTGKIADGKTEILDGLADGDEVLMSKP